MWSVKRRIVPALLGACALASSACAYWGVAIEQQRLAWEQDDTPPVFSLPAEESQELKESLNLPASSFLNANFPGTTNLSGELSDSDSPFVGKMFLVLSAGSLAFVVVRVATQEARRDA